MKQSINNHERTSSKSRLSPKDLRGIVLPLPTPFDQAGEVDLHALQSNIEKWNKTEVRGYVVLGSTGEPAHLDERERASVIDAARRATPGDRVFIVGAGQQSTRATITEVRAAATAGAEAVLVLTPHFYRAAMTSAALINHYITVADASPVPVLLYSVPQFTGIALAPDAVARLSEHANIIGIKDSSGDYISLSEVLRLVPREFAVLTGHAALLYPALCAGACGAIVA
ncbi:MAG: dihydrodipicolinate synthase family protein, partial [Pyrinomonadaceae bacterium]|nr:dihydrodipicolinate synthase family protein [Pyrinomonadaceae bacterium]